MHPTSEDLFKTRALPLFASGMRVLEMGPDNVYSTYRRFLDEAGVSVDWYFADFHSTEQDERRIAMAHEYDIDIHDEVFDIVFHGQVLEHVTKIWRWLPETARVLKKGGKMIIINPAAWEYHAVPVDCWRAYPAGVSALFEDSGLSVDFSEWFLVDPTNNNGQADTITVGTKTGAPLIRFT